MTEIRKSQLRQALAAAKKKGDKKAAKHFEKQLKSDD